MEKFGLVNINSQLPTSILTSGKMYVSKILFLIATIYDYFIPADYVIHKSFIIDQDRSYHRYGYIFFSNKCLQFELIISQ